MPLDPDHPLLRPVWVRLLVVAIPTIAAAAGFATGAVALSVLFIAIGAFLFQRLVLGPAVGRRDDDDAGDA